MVLIPLGTKTCPTRGPSDANGHCQVTSVGRNVPLHQGWLEDETRDIGNVCTGGSLQSLCYCITHNLCLCSGILFNRWSSRLHLWNTAYSRHISQCRTYWQSGGNEKIHTDHCKRPNPRSIWVMELLPLSTMRQCYSVLIFKSISLWAL